MSSKPRVASGFGRRIGFGSRGNPQPETPPESPYNLTSWCTILPESFKRSLQRPNKSQTAIDFPGLGELAAFPRELRDKIYAYALSLADLEDAVKQFEESHWPPRHWPPRHEQGSGVSLLRTSKEIWEEALPWLYRTNWLVLEIGRQHRGYTIRVSHPVFNPWSSLLYNYLYLSPSISEHLLQSARKYSVHCNFRTLFASDDVGQQDNFCNQPDIRTFQTSLINQIRQLSFIFAKSLHLQELDIHINSHNSAPTLVLDLLHPVISLRGLRGLKITMGGMRFHGGLKMWNISKEYRQYIEEVVKSPRGTPAPLFDEDIHERFEEFNVIGQ